MTITKNNALLLALTLTCSLAHANSVLEHAKDASAWWTYRAKDFKHRNDEGFDAGHWDDDSLLKPYAPNADALIDLAAFFGMHSRNKHTIRAAGALTTGVKATDAVLGFYKPYDIYRFLTQNADSVGIDPHIRAGSIATATTGVLHALAQARLAGQTARAVRHADALAARNKRAHKYTIAAYKKERNWQIALTLLHCLTRVWERSAQNNARTQTPIDDLEIKLPGEFYVYIPRDPLSWLGIVATLNFLIHSYQQHRLTTYYKKAIAYARNPENEAGDYATLQKAEDAKRPLLQKLKDTGSSALNAVKNAFRTKKEDEA